MLVAMLTTASAPRATRASALTRSMSVWSITAISPGWSRLVRFFVRRSRRGPPARGAPPARGGRRAVGVFLAPPVEAGHAGQVARAGAGGSPGREPHRTGFRDDDPTAPIV